MSENLREQTFRAMKAAWRDRAMSVSFDVTWRAVTDAAWEVVGPELDRLRAKVERLTRRLGQCRAKHPTNPTVVPCVLDHGHDGDEHVSSTGCAGSVVRWLTAEAEREVLRARLAKVEADSAGLEVERNMLRSTLGEVLAEADGLRSTVARIGRVAKTAAITSRAASRPNDERNWLDVLAIIDIAALASVPEPSDSEPAPTEVDSLRLELEKARRRLEREAAEPRCPTCGGRGADPCESSKDRSRCPDAFHSEPAPDADREAGER